MSCRPFSLETSRLVQPKTGQPPTLANLEGIGSVTISGVTFATDAGDLTLPWLTDLANFFAVGGYQGGAEATPLAPPAMTWSVALQDVAVRYEPSNSSCEPQHAQHDNGASLGQKPSPVSAILTLAGLLWKMQPGVEEQRIILQCLGLYCAESALRQGGWTPSHANHVPAMPLANSGYSLVAQENQLEIALKPPVDVDTDFFQTEVSNQRLSTSLTKTQMRLVNSLVSQWTGQSTQAPVSMQDESASTGSSRQHPSEAQGHVTRRNLKQGSEEGTVEWQGLSEGHLRVMDGVQEDAFKK